MLRLVSRLKFRSALIQEQRVGSVAARAKVNAEEALLFKKAICYSLYVIPLYRSMYNNDR